MADTISPSHPTTRRADGVQRNNSASDLQFQKDGDISEGSRQVDDQLAFAERDRNLAFLSTRPINLNSPKLSSQTLPNSSGTIRSVFNNDSGVNLSGSLTNSKVEEDRPFFYTPMSRPASTKSEHKTTFTRVFCLLLLIAVLFSAVFFPVYYLVFHKKHNKAVNLAPSNSPTGATTGGDGSLIKLDNGTVFMYNNSFGGFWVQYPQDPFNNNAQPNSWTPPLNSSWTWGKDRIYGVNLGGLFVLEPFITPSIFQKYPKAVDEYSLSQAMAADQAGGGLSQLENHYNTFITEQDIAEIAGAGLNFIRVPIAFWAIETWAGEPYLAKTSWKYLIRILNWARKYGLRVCLDLHAVPGAQNPFNHSGRVSSVNFLAGNMGLANAERTLYYIRILTEFISQPQYRNLVPIFGIVNEPMVTRIGMDEITSFYLKAHDMIRNITGFGDGHGPFIAIHDGFQPVSAWDSFLGGSDRIVMDKHPYYSFGGQQTSAPLGVVGDQGIPGGQWPLNACNNFGSILNDSRTSFGVTFAGEFAASPNDCGLFLRGVGQTSSNPRCQDYDAWENYNDTMKQGIRNFIKAEFDALGDWFFWTWKIGPSQAGRIESPLWSYQLGLRNGWIPKDPREASGMCMSIGASSHPFTGPFRPWQTGNPSATSIAASSSSEYPWPPFSISSASVDVSLLPTYTNTAPIITLAPATFTAAPSSVTASVNGWYNTLDTEGGVITVSGCPYPFEYDGIFNVFPTAPCTGPGSAPTSTSINFS